jgi:hypothetical protein
MKPSRFATSTEKGHFGNFVWQTHDSRSQAACLARAIQLLHFASTGVSCDLQFSAVHGAVYWSTGTMSRHLDNLNALASKLKGRYGEEDDAVHEVELEVRKLKEIETAHQDLFPPRRPHTWLAAVNARSDADRMRRF